MAGKTRTIADNSSTDTTPARPWHSLAHHDVLTAHDARTDGLDAAHAADRLRRFGPNRLPQAAARGVFARLFAQVHNVLIYVLLVAAVISLLLDHAVDAAVIFAVVIVNAVIGFVQEGRAEQALQAIAAMIDPKASALRDGHRVSIPADMIVPGDIVLIEAGDRVPADLRLIRARNLRIEEAVLTGESMAVEKSIEAVNKGSSWNRVGRF